MSNTGPSIHCPNHNEAPTKLLRPATINISTTCSFGGDSVCWQAASLLNTGQGWYKAAMYFIASRNRRLVASSCLRAAALGHGRAAVLFSVAMVQGWIKGDKSDCVAVLEQVDPLDTAYKSSMFMLAMFYEIGYGCPKNVKRSIMADIIRHTL